MPEHCIEISTGSIPVERLVPGWGKALHIIVLALCVAAVGGSLLLQHGGDGLYLFGIEWPLNCRLYQDFGVKCALCGLTRSFSSVAEADLSEAVQFHPLGPVVFVFLSLQIPYRIYVLRRTGAENRMFRRLGIYSALLLAVALLINWFVYLGGLAL